MTARTNHADAIGGIALLGCVAMIVFAIALDGWRTYAPLLRAWLIDAAYTAHDYAAAAWSWQLALGVMLCAVGAALIAMAMERIES